VDLVGEPFNEGRQRRAHGRRTSDAQFERRRHNPEEYETLRIAVEPAHPVQQIRDADLMRRQPLLDGRRHVRAFESHQRSGGRVGADGVDEDGGVGLFEIRQEREAERPAVQDLDLGRPFERSIEGAHRDRSQPVVAAQDIAEPEDQQRT
jgi:hypothetical protein